MKKINLKKNTTYSESEIVDIIKDANPSASTIKIKWLLFDLEKNNSITRVGIKKYVTDGRTYYYGISELSKDIDALISNNYPDIEYIIWESNQLNEWMNLLFSKNIIFIEVEKDLIEFIFLFLQENYGKRQSVLFNPTIDILSRYIDNNPIVVKPLFSRSPKSKQNHKISAEKILVDIFCDRLLVSMIGTNDRDEIAKGIIRNYSINETKTLAYAKRRRCDKEIQYFLEEKND